MSTPATVTFPDAPAGLRFVRLAPGVFIMGSPAREPGREPQEVEHQVRLTTPFFLGATEVTQAQWVSVMDANPSHFADCATCPVENVSYHDVQQFLARLNARGDGGFRLPTEAEWEFACRAGGRLPFGHTDRLDPSDANINGLYPYNAPGGVESQSTRPVRNYQPNRWGLYDMAGNVWEWTADDHCPYDATGATDPRGACGGQLKVIRGGSWKFDGNSARCALRYTHRPQDRGFSLGVRLARDASRR